MQKGAVVSSLNAQLSFPTPGEVCHPAAAALPFYLPPLRQRRCSQESIVFSQAMEVDEAPTCTVQELGQGMDSSQLFMMDRLQDKVSPPKRAFFGC